MFQPLTRQLTKGANPLILIIYNLFTFMMNLRRDILYCATLEEGLVYYFTVVPSCLSKLIIECVNYIFLHVHVGVNAHF